MKRSVGLSLIAVLLLFTSRVTAQAEFVAGYGLFSAGEVDNTFYHSNTKRVLNLNDDFKAYTNGIGPWIIGYKREFNDNISLGVIGVMTFLRTNYYGDKMVNGSPVDSKQTVSSSQYSTLVRFEYFWVHMKNLNVYSSLAGGVGYQYYNNTTENISLNKFGLAYQANFLGLRAGNKLGAFFELGYGHAGIANIGVSLYF